MTEQIAKTSDLRVCYACGSNTTYISKTGNIQWFGNPPIGWLCKRCNNRYIVNPTWKPITNQTKVRFKNTYIYTGLQPRVGVCNLCRAVKGEINCQIGILCKNTGMHHELYHEEDPLKDAIELCNHCHGLVKRIRWIESIRSLSL